jgi:hypothetical protein
VIQKPGPRAVQIVHSAEFATGLAFSLAPSFHGEGKGDRLIGPFVYKNLARFEVGEANSAFVIEFEGFHAGIFPLESALFNRFWQRSIGHSRRLIGDRLPSGSGDVLSAMNFSTVD